MRFCGAATVSFGGGTRGSSSSSIEPTRRRRVFYSFFCSCCVLSVSPDAERQRTHTDDGVCTISLCRGGPGTFAAALVRATRSLVGGRGHSSNTLYTRRHGRIAARRVRLPCRRQTESNSAQFSSVLFACVSGRDVCGFSLLPLGLFAFSTTKLGVPSHPFAPDAEVRGGEVYVTRF